MTMRQAWWVAWAITVLAIVVAAAVVLGLFPP
jgi:hypothetical protein